MRLIYAFIMVGLCGVSKITDTLLLFVSCMLAYLFVNFIFVQVVICRACVISLLVFHFCFHF